MNISGIITIIPANWTTSGRRSRSPIRPNRALIAPASTISTTQPGDARRRRCRGSGSRAAPRRTDEQHGAGDREDGLVDRAGDAGQCAWHGKRGEAVVETVGVVDRGGDSDVGAGHDGGDGEHRRGDEVDVADAGREVRAVGDAAEDLAEQDQHRHRHRQREHQQLRDPGGGAQVAWHEGGELVTAGAVAPPSRRLSSVVR